MPPQGAGRFDNPSEYRILYGSREPAAAIAEAFGRYAQWNSALFVPPPNARPDARRALATLTLSDDTPIVDLDDPRMLLQLGTRPSRVITRDYATTQAIARKVFRSRSAGGLSWWSYYESLWTNLGVWNLRALDVQEMRELSSVDATLQQAAAMIGRPIEA